MASVFANVRDLLCSNINPYSLCRTQTRLRRSTLLRLVLCKVKEGYFIILNFSFCCQQSVLDWNEVAFCISQTVIVYCTYTYIVNRSLLHKCSSNDEFCFHGRLMVGDRLWWYMGSLFSLAYNVVHFPPLCQFSMSRAPPPPFNSVFCMKYYGFTRHI